MSTSITFVIPTRNRAELAMRAAAGLLAEGGEELRVVVSDNSSDAQQAQRMEEFCRGRGDGRLTYLRSPVPSMASHWNWALEQALATQQTTHFTVHYDRKVPKPGRMRELLDAIERRPDRVVTYAIDQIVGQPPRFVLWQPPWSGRLYDISTARVCAMTAEGRIAEMGHAFPILSNCAVPRPVFGRIRRRFGDICDSTSPDAAFTYRFCALEESYVHLDASLSVIYAIHRSNGAGYLSGKPTDFADFKLTWGDRPWIEAAPLPGVELGWNMLFHEYELVRREIGGERLPPLSMPGYLDALAYGLRFVGDDERRSELEALLERQGWRAPPVARASRPSLKSRVAALLRRQQVTLFLARRLGVKPAHITGFTFASEAEALDFATRFPRRRLAHPEGLDWIQDAGRPSPEAKLTPLHGA